MKKQVIKAISYVIFGKDKKLFLVVQRPEDDDNLPNAWGLPAGSLKDNETWQDAVLRSGIEKLDVKLKVLNELNEGRLEREEYTLYMKLFEAEIIDGIPSVPQNIEGITQYQNWKWGTSNDLKAAATNGSLCCKLYLKLIDEKSS